MKRGLKWCLDDMDYSIFTVLSSSFRYKLMKENPTNVMFVTNDFRNLATYRGIKQRMLQRNKSFMNVMFARNGCPIQAL